MLNYSVYISSIGHLPLHDQCKQDALFALIMKRMVLLTCQLLFSRRYPLCLFSSAVSTPPSLRGGGGGLADPVRQFFFSPSRLSPGDRTHVWPFSFGVMSPAELEQRTPLREVEHDCRAAGEKSADVCQAGRGRHGLHQLQCETCVSWWTHVRTF